MSSFLKTNYNPDVLSCLANLSNDEVFTPPEVANQMLDRLPESLWRNPNAKFLDPVCKSGVFLREIAKRLINGLADEIPDLQTRLNHIFTQQLYGIAITELTGHISRRSLYCAKYANSPLSVCTAFGENGQQGNIRYRRIEHTWKNGKCTDCGASQDVYDRDSDELENHAYAFIHGSWAQKILETENMKFDVIIGNPPYQLGDGSGASSDAAMPIYQLFIEQAIKLNPDNLLMIVPSRWMVGGRGLNKFREKMIEDRRIKTIVDFEKSADCFAGLHIDGGVNYFLWQKDYDGLVDYTFIAYDGTKTQSIRSLKNEFFQYVIRNNQTYSLIEKVASGERFSSIVSSTKPYGIRKYLFNEPQRYPEAHLSSKPFENCVKIHGVKGIKGGAKRVEGYIVRNAVENGLDSIDKYKLFFTTTYSTNAINPPEIIQASPNTVCTETFLRVGCFETEQEQQNCLQYMQTNFFKVLLYLGKGTMQVTKSVFQLIPLQDFSKSWTDTELYAKYSLTADEITFIEKMVRPMELESE